MFRALASTLFAGPSDLALLVLVSLRRASSNDGLRLATLAVAQALDLATFRVMVAAHGVGTETNPLVSDLFIAHGLPALAMGKFALVVLIGALSVAAAARGRRGVWSVVGGLPLALAIAAGLIGGITNTASILG